MPFNCSYCGTRKPYRLASVYWRWYREDHESVGYKLRYCQEHVVENLQLLGTAWIAARVRNPQPWCYLCERGDVATSREVYADVYLPKAEPFKLSARLCEDHYSDFIEELIAHGETLQDRQLFDNERAQEAWGRIASSFSG